MTVARKLTGGVVVRHPVSHDPVFLPEGTDLPDWADGLVGDHVLSGVAVKSAGKGGSSVKPPPQAGKGSGLDEWLRYATQVGVQVEDEASRADVIAAVEGAGLPVD